MKQQIRYYFPLAFLLAAIVSFAIFWTMLSKAINNDNAKECKTECSRQFNLCRVKAKTGSDLQKCNTAKYACESKCTKPSGTN